MKQIGTLKSFELSHDEFMKLLDLKGKLYFVSYEATKVVLRVEDA